jgi:hypothetical protein
MNVLLKNKHVDVATFRINAFAENNDPVNTVRLEKYSKYFDDVFNVKVHDVSTCNKIFKAEIIRKRNIRFIEWLKYSEDHFFSHAFTICSNNHAFINAPLYNYRLWNNSATGKTVNSDGKFAMHTYYNYDALIEFAKRHNLFEKFKGSIYSRYIGNVKLFCNDQKRISDAITHWDSQILDSECPDNLKMEYLKRRKEIKQAVNL